jgi:hypothetical protein
MMGERRVMQEALFYRFNLERHVPDNHLVGKIDRFVFADSRRCRLLPAVRQRRSSTKSTESGRRTHAFNTPRRLKLSGFGGLDKSLHATTSTPTSRPSGRAFPIRGSRARSTKPARHDVHQGPRNLADVNMSGWYGLLPPPKAHPAASGRFVPIRTWSLRASCVGPPRA